MAFRFDFPDPDLRENSSEKSEYCDKTEGDAKNESERVSDLDKKHVSVPCEEIYVDEQIIKECKDFPVTTYDFADDVSVTCYVSDVLADIYNTNNPDSSLSKVVSSNIDVIPNEYEGGLTVWESSIDLSQYLTSGEIDVKGKTVLELGCGAGIPGICAMKRGAKEVHFQDFNSEVLKHYTIPNVIKLNEGFECNCRYFSGDWENVSITLGHMIKGESFVKYDYILTAETIYNPENYHKLYSVFEHLLADTGCIYLAAKSHYFGATASLGGGTFLFMDYVGKKGKFTASVCKTIEAVVPREILKIEWMKENS